MKANKKNRDDKRYLFLIVLIVYSTFYYYFIYRFLFHFKEQIQSSSQIKINK